LIICLSKAKTPHMRGVPRLLVKSHWMKDVRLTMTASFIGWCRTNVCWPNDFRPKVYWQNDVILKLYWPNSNYFWQFFDQMVFDQMVFDQMVFDQMFFDQMFLDQKSIDKIFFYHKVLMNRYFIKWLLTKCFLTICYSTKCLLAKIRGPSISAISSNLSGLIWSWAYNIKPFTAVTDLAV